MADSPPETQVAPTALVAWVRLVIVGLFAAFVFGGPGYRQGLAKHHPRVFKTWKMYSGYAIDECSTRYWLVENGRHRRISRNQTLYGTTEWWTLSWGQRILRRRGATSDARRMCRALGDVDLRGEIQCAGLYGWDTLVTPDEDLCP